MTQYLRRMSSLEHTLEKKLCFGNESCIYAPIMHIVLGSLTQIPSRKIVPTFSTIIEQYLIVPSTSNKFYVF
jgi:hypothetical protein